MGWTIYSNKSRSDVLALELKCSPDWEMIWSKSTSAIYRRKSDGELVHNFIIIKKEKNGDIAAKNISDFRTVAAATAYVKFAEDYIAVHDGKTPLYYAEAVAMVTQGKKKRKISTLKPGDKVYIKDCYNYCGEGKVVQLLARSIVVQFPNVPRNITCSNNSVDLEKTFG